MGHEEVVIFLQEVYELCKLELLFYNRSHENLSGKRKKVREFPFYDIRRWLHAICLRRITSHIEGKRISLHQTILQIEIAQQCFQRGELRPLVELLNGYLGGLQRLPDAAKKTLNKKRVEAMLQNLRRR